MASLLLTSKLPRGVMAVILYEIYWVWLPGVVLMLVLMGWRMGGWCPQWMLRLAARW
jgi:hypothetical protein